MYERATQGGTGAFSATVEGRCAPSMAHLVSFKRGTGPQSFSPIENEGWLTANLLPGPTGKTGTMNFQQQGMIDDRNGWKIEGIVEVKSNGMVSARTTKARPHFCDLRVLMGSPA